MLKKQLVNVFSGGGGSEVELFFLKCKAYLELGDILNPDIISDCSHDDSDFVLTAGKLHLTDLGKKINKKKKKKKLRQINV